MDQLLGNLGSPNVTGVVIGFLLTSVLAFVLWFVRRRRWDRIVVELISQSPQISISEDLAEDITIRYRGDSTSQVVLTQLRVFNQGDDTIEDLVFFIEAELVSGSREKNWLTPPKVLDVVEKTTYEKGESSHKDISDLERRSKFTYKFSRPFMNPIRNDKDEELLITFFSSHEVGLRVFGSGPGWSVKYLEIQAEKPIVLFTLPVFLAYLIVSIIVSYFAADYNPILGMIAGGLSLGILFFLLRYRRTNN
jgi:hypothetical protein